MAQLYVVFDGMTLYRATVHKQKETDFPEEWEAYRRVLRTKRKFLLITDSILREYDRVFADRPRMFVKTLLDDAEKARKLLRRSGRPNPSIRGLGKEHDALVKSAVFHGCQYLVRVDPQRWANIKQYLRRQYALNILTPAEFVAQNGANR